jgi:hypothetical protein
MHFSSPHPYKMNKELFHIQLFINLLSAILDRCQRHLGKLKKIRTNRKGGGFYRRPVDPHPSEKLDADPQQCYNIA